MGYKKMLNSSLQIFDTIVFNLLSRWCNIYDNLCMGFPEIQGTVQKKQCGSFSQACSQGGAPPQICQKVQF